MPPEECCRWRGCRGTVTPAEPPGATPAAPSGRTELLAARQGSNKCGNASAARGARRQPEGHGLCPAAAGSGRCRQDPRGCCMAQHCQRHVGASRETPSRSEDATREMPGWTCSGCWAAEQGCIREICTMIAATLQKGPRAMGRDSQHLTECCGSLRQDPEGCLRLVFIRHLQPRGKWGELLSAPA